MPGQVFVTGASGFVGSAVVDELIRRGYGATALVNRAELKQPGVQVRVVRGGLFDEQVLEGAMRDCVAVIHLVGIIFEQPSKQITFERMHVEGTANVVEAARRAGVVRYIHMSALGARPDAASRYHRTKFEAEQIVRRSSLKWTIFEPSMIHGPRGDFMKMEAGWAMGRRAPFLFMPYFGAGIFGRSGAGKLQPIYVRDVARAFVNAIETPETIGKLYQLAGPQAMTWPILHRTVSVALTGKTRRVVPVPAWYATALTRLLPASLLPFNRDQVIMSQEDNTADIRPFVKDFGWIPSAFEPSLQGYVTDLAGWERETKSEP